jgi:hypothetical protein
MDTNILLYAANKDAEEHEAASRFVRSAGESPDRWYLTEGVLYEFLRVSTHPRVFARPLSWKEALSFLRPILDCPAFSILVAGDDHWALLERELRALSHPSGNLLYDVRTVVLMREHGLRTIYSTDTDFLQFAGLTVVNPLRRPA